MYTEMKDRTDRKVITSRISCGRPGAKVNGQPAKGSRPTALDHFIITGVEEQSDGSFVDDKEAMRRVSEMNPKRYGPPDKLVAVPIRLVSDDIGDSLVQAYRARRTMPQWGKDGQPIMHQRDGDAAPSQVSRPVVWCEGNGVTARRLSKDGKDWHEIPCRPSPSLDRERPELIQILSGRVKHDPRVDEKRCPYAQAASRDAQRDADKSIKDAPKCKPETVLIERCDAVASIGVFARFRSHGHETADRIRSTLKAIKDAIPGGILADIPLDLCLQMKRVGGPGSRPLPIVHIELRLPPEETVALIERNMEARIKLIGQVEQLKGLLAEAKKEAEEEVVEGEFSITGRGEGGGGLKT